MDASFLVQPLLSYLLSSLVEEFRIFCPGTRTDIHIWNGRHLWSTMCIFHHFRRCSDSLRSSSVLLNGNAELTAKRNGRHRRTLTFIAKYASPSWFTVAFPWSSAVTVFTSWIRMTLCTIFARPTYFATNKEILQLHVALVHLWYSYRHSPGLRQ